jgi:pilin isopeptide linkage protein/LPXTG-motif cell wall-anchored protein
MKDGQHVVLANLPANATYEVQEIDVPDGFTLASSEGTTGTIALGDSSEASFTNAYGTSGSVSLEATKILKGASLADGQFAFELRDAEGHTLQTAHNDANGMVAFSPISYSASDDGKTFTYRIVEVNDGQDGVTYDTHTCLVEVTVADDGAGNLTTTTTYKTDSPLGTDTSNNTFTNTAASALPQTGGSGLGWTIGLGMLVLVTALIMFWKRDGLSWLDSFKRGDDE